MQCVIIEQCGEPLPLSFADGVEYRSVPGFPGYAVGSDGSVWSCKRRGRWIRRKASQWKQTKRGGPCYQFLALSRDGDNFSFYVHRLVLFVFKGPPTLGTEARHLNSNYMDHRAENLEWGTPEQNSQDKIDNGSCRGHRNGRARFTEADVRAIRQRRANGESLKSIAASYGRHKSIIHHVCTGYTWGHVSS